jgi:hypothetical protein
MRPKHANGAAAGKRKLAGHPLSLLGYLNLPTIFPTSISSIDCFCGVLANIVLVRTFRCHPGRRAASVLSPQESRWGRTRVHLNAFGPSRQSALMPAVFISAAAIAAALYLEAPAPCCPRDQANGSLISPLSKIRPNSPQVVSGRFSRLIGWARRAGVRFRQNVPVPLQLRCRHR